MRVIVDDKKLIDTDTGMSAIRTADDLTINFPGAKEPFVVVGCAVIQQVWNLLTGHDSFDSLDLSTVMVGNVRLQRTGHDN